MELGYMFKRLEVREVSTQKMDEDLPFSNEQLIKLFNSR